MNEYLELYHAFRYDIDELCGGKIIELARADGGFREIRSGNELVGFLIAINGYIEGLYIKPEYRRQGFGRKAVLSFIRQGGRVEHLHIVNDNKIARKFWFSIFELRKIESTPIDTFYEIVRVKE